MSHSYYLILFFLLLILYIEHRNKIAVMKKLLQAKNKKEKSEMIELAKRFVGQECLIYTFNSQLTGVVKEVSDGAILLESKSGVEAVNLDFIIRIREYPKTKKGKKKSVVLD